MRKLIGTIAGVGALFAVAVQSVAAVDYSSQITAAGADLATDVTPALAAALVIALTIMALFIGAKLALGAFGLARKKG